MLLGEILPHFRRNRGFFAKDAVLAAVAQREEITPALLDILEDAAAQPEFYAADPDGMTLMYAMYLLAQFRETRAYPLLVQIFSLPGEMPFNLVGDTVTEGLDKILASVSGGDPAGMRALIENEQANPYVRAAAISGLVTLVVEGLRTREETVEYFRSLFQRLERRPGDTWAWLSGACADLWPEETMLELRIAWRDGLIPPDIIHRDDIEDDFKRGKEECLRRLRGTHRLVSDVAKEMAWWHCFQPMNIAEHGKPPVDERPAVREQFLLPRTAAKVGRNEPCPCLSGKKFKKCCGS
jgi:hypothetical protein